MTTIANISIITMDNDKVIENGYISFDESSGKIIEVSAGRPNSDGKIIDGNGFVAAPGFIDGHTHLGLIESSLTFEGDDCNETGEPCEPGLRALDGINPFDSYFDEARAAGVTTVAVAPGSANPIGGQICVIKTSGRRVDNMLVQDAAAMKFALGENPKSVYHGKNQSPETRMATAAMIREMLIKASKYNEKMKEYSSGDAECDEPEYDMKNEALAKVLDREMKAHFHAHRADDIFTAMRIANEFSLDYIIVHCTEGYKIADELAAEGVGAFVGPNLCDRSKPELAGLTFDNPRILAENGVLFALTTDHPVIPINYLPLCASLAEKNGLSHNEALKSVTVNPAKLLGIEDRVGSIKAGLDADIVLFDGEPLNFDSHVKSVYINGKIVYNA